MFQKPIRSIVSILVLIFAAGLCFAQEKRANAQEPKRDSGQEPAVKTGAGSPAEDDDSDSPDIPPIARGKIDPATYLRLRGELVALKRGLADLAQDPQARSRAIRQMELQEQLIRRFQERAAQSAGGTGPSSTIVPPPPSWTPLGPDPIPNGQTDPNFILANEKPVSGRVLSIAIDPTDATANTVYVGTAQGGLYRTLDGGATWTALMDSAQSLVIGAITIDPLDPNTLFVGTGEGNFCLDCFFGVGLYIIRNASTTADLTGPFNSNGASDVFTGRSITQIVVNPADDNKILVSTASGFSGASGDAFNILPGRGLYLSTNALTGAPPTFTRQVVPPLSANLSATDIAMDPANPATVVVNIFDTLGTGLGGIYVSTAGDPWVSGSATWTREFTPAQTGNGKLFVNRSGSTPATTFFAALDERVSCNGGASKEGTLYKSVSPFTTWTQIPKATGFCGGQCFYDIALAVDPANVNVIYLGGAAGSATGSCGSGILGKSTDGTNFAPSQTLLHADSHATAIAPSNHLIIYTGNDGGVFRSADGGGTWSSINTAGFNATQFESLSVHPTDANFSIGGTQDNGTPRLLPDGVTWTRADFGDGGFSAIDSNATDTTTVTMYHTYFNATNNLIGLAQVTSVASATEGNWNFFGCGGTANGISCADSVLFYAPLALGPGTPNTVYFGTNRLYRSVNLGVNMAAVSQAPLVPNFSVSAIGISAQDDNVRIVGLADGSVFATTTGSSTLTDVTGGWAAMYIARAVIDPNNRFTAYVTLDGYGTASHVWKTTNLNGAPPTWTSMSSGIPDVPVNAFAVDPANSNFLYAGTDIGVYNSTDGGTTWNPFGTGLPRMAVFDLNIQPTSHKVRIGTHGRGAWEIAAVPSLADTTGLSASSNSPIFGANVTLTATIDKGSGVPVPTGTVTFNDGVNALGTGAVNGSAQATFSTSTLAVGAHNITAVYGGDTFYAASTSAVVVVTVIPVDFTLPAMLTPTSQMVNSGQSATYTLAIGQTGGFSSSVSFTCSLPAIATTCMVNPASQIPGMSVTITATTTVRTLLPPPIGRRLPRYFLPVLLLAMALLFARLLYLAGSRRRRLAVAVPFAALLLLAVYQAVGCGGSSTPPPVIHGGTPVGTYTITVTGTSGASSHTSTGMLVVN
jgi:Bacterial Ig-like domain (group 3)